MMDAENRLGTVTRNKAQELLANPTEWQGELKEALAGAGVDASINLNTPVADVLNAFAQVPSQISGLSSNLLNMALALANGEGDAALTPENIREMLLFLSPLLQGTGEGEPMRTEQSEEQKISEAAQELTGYLQSHADGNNTEPKNTQPILADVFKQAARLLENRQTSLVPVRTGRRLQTKPPAELRMPTSEPAKEVFTSLFAPDWNVAEGGGAIYIQRGKTQIRVACDETLNFGPQQAIHQIAQFGPSAAQTFLSMAGLWMQENAGQSHETYTTAYASDLLRFQGRAETPKGGYHNEDIQAKGRDVFLLSRVSIPTAHIVEYPNSRKTVRTLSIGSLFMIQSLEIQQTIFETDTQCVVKFRYHLGRELFEWIGGDTPQYRTISSKLLAYHPVREKYKILFGFCLTYFDRVNDKRKAERKISLPALLNLAGIEEPKLNVARFLKQIGAALAGLSSDGIIPGLQLDIPRTPNLSEREKIQQAQVTFPILIPAPVAQ